MSDLTSTEKLRLERLLGMSSGYVLGFSNRNFQEFVLENTNLDIYDEKYNYYTGSKANRLRAFWDIESNYLVGKLIAALLEYWKTEQQLSRGFITTIAEQSAFEECMKIAERLKQESPVEHVEVIQPNADDRDFSLLAKSIRESIEKNEPEVALDRLHTFVVKYFRQLCQKHQLSYAKEDPLHSLFGKYTKLLISNKLIDSEMTERILKYSIHVLEAFNDVRNNQSLAHDNPILNYHESILIFNSVTNTIKFIETVEQSSQAGTEESEVKWGDIPF